MTTGVDDAVLCPMLMAHGTSKQILPLLAVQMFPPAGRATEMLELFARRVGLEHVTGPVSDWRPGRRKPAVQASVARNGRWVVTATRGVIFDDSTAAVAPDGLDQAWIDTAGEIERALIFIGGPRPLQTPNDLEAAAAASALIGGWTAVTLPPAT
ncbi:hypothetical protein [Janibacter alittae]|uniref:Uncharacterized protein n=1 Tax=Janibacter alittae TaxID=3115209 RepID=A0ABZ2MDM2_9MICO